MLKIYYHPISGPSNKVRYGLQALHLDYEEILVDLQKGEQDMPEHLARNPFGKVPVLDDDGFLLFESDAILRYLARREKSVLYPSTYKERAIVDQWIDFSSFMLNLSMQKVFFNRVIAPLLGEQPDEKIIQQGLAQVESYLPVYDKHLSASPFMCGEVMTLADICLLSVLDPFEISKIDLSSYTSLLAWRDKLRKQEFYTNVHEYYGQGIFPA